MTDEIEIEIQGGRSAMSKIAFIADVHLGNHAVCGGPVVAGINARARETIDALFAAKRIADSYHARLYVLGDLFDSTKPPPQIIAEAQRVLRGTYNTHLLMGNHDRNSDVSGDHALGPMVRQQVIASPEPMVYDNEAVICLPFSATPAKDWLPLAIESWAAECRDAKLTVAAVVAHVGLHDEGMRNANPWCADSPGAIDVALIAAAMKRAGIEYFFAGDWHMHHVWESDGVVVIQVGALVPTGWDNPGVKPYGSVLILDTDTGDFFRETIPGPRFVNVASEAELLDYLREAEAADCTLRVRWKTTPDRVAGAQDVMSRYPRIIHASVHLDAKEAEKTARSAAAAATSASTVEEALGRYVAKMSLPPTAIMGEAEFRQRVVDTAAELLRGAR